MTRRCLRCTASWRTPSGSVPTRSAMPSTWVPRPRQQTSLSTGRSARTPGGSACPLIVWEYPRGSAIGAKGGRDSFYAVDHAARTANELGANLVKVNFPHPEKRAGVPAQYDADLSSQPATDAVVRSANRTLVLVPGGSRAGDEAMLDKARQSADAGRHRADLRPQHLAARARRVAAAG